jgi:hypothetical protein
MRFAIFGRNSRSAILHNFAVGKYLSDDQPIVRSGGLGLLVQRDRTKPSSLTCPDFF